MTQEETVTRAIHPFWWGWWGAIATLVLVSLLIGLVGGFYWDAYESGFKCGRYSIGCDGRFQAEEK